MVPRRPETGPPLPADPDAACAAFKAQADAAHWADAANKKLVGGGGTRTAAAAATPPPSPVARATPGDANQPVAPDEPVKVWCEEVPNELGRSFRQFLAASFAALWRRGRFGCVGLAPGRHVYEVLREGRPCHLYFDLEFVPAANPNLDGDALVDALVALVGADARARWGCALDPAAHVLEADSSTPDKWSRHLLVRLPGGVAFRDGQAVGRYVAELLAHGAADALRVRKAGGSGGGRGGGAADWTWVVDTAVYTRHRHFRTLLSSKFGKAAPLMPTHRFVCGPDGPGEVARPGAGPGGAAGAPPPSTAAPAWSLRDLWLFSLATAVEPGARLVDVAPRDPWVDGRLGVPGGSGARALPAGWGLEEACAMLDRQAGAGGLAGPQPQPHATPAAAASSVARVPLPPGVGPRYGLGYKYDPRDAPPDAGPPAPDPGLVALVQATTPLVEATAAARAGGRPAYVRRATVCGRRGDVVAFTLLGPGSHWCGRKGGHHASNYVYYLVNYAAGAAAQKCHDPDCAGYASEPEPLPEWLARQAARVLGMSGSGAGLSLDGV
jgi:hypothetical protein